MAVQAQEVPGGELVLRFDGDFAAPDAWKVHEVLLGADPVHDVVLDFSQVHRFEDFAVALMAPDLVASSNLHVRLRGLGLHQQRILEYFGVRPSARDERARRDGFRGEVRV